MSRSLHIVTKAPSDSSPLWASALSDGDGVIFIEDGAYWINKSSSILSDIRSKLDLSFNVLEDDILARGLTHKEHDLNIISYANFVEITTTFQRSVTW